MLWLRAIIINVLWLWAIIINVLTTGEYDDIAVRDLGLSVGALSLARLAQLHALERHGHGETAPPYAEPTGGSRRGLACLVVRRAFRRPLTENARNLLLARRRSGINCGVTAAVPPTPRLPRGEWGIS